MGNRVALPANAEEPINVYINGVKQVRGEDYMVEGRHIHFREPIYKEELKRLSPIRKLGLGLGLFGLYERNETIDIEYRSGGKTKLASDVQVISDLY